MAYVIITKQLNQHHCAPHTYLNRYLEILDDVQTVEHLEHNFKVD